MPRKFARSVRRSLIRAKVLSTLTSISAARKVKPVRALRSNKGVYKRWLTRPNSNQARLKRHARVRSKVSGTAACPRLDVFRSNSNIYAQLIDDVNGVTLAAASSNEKDFGISGGNKEGAHKVGKLIAERAAEKGITEVVFDRGGYIYHGRVKELAEGAREGGLKF